MKNIFRWRYVIAVPILAVLIFVGSLIVFPDWGQSHQLILALIALAVSVAIQTVASWIGLWNTSAQHSASTVASSSKVENSTAGRDITSISIAGNNNVINPPATNLSHSPATPEELKAQCAQQREFMTRDLVGSVSSHRKFTPDLYIQRPSAYAVFQDFKQSAAACLAILGESGVGKSNFLIAISEPSDEEMQAFFYEGIRLKSGFAGALKEDMPWAFGVNNSLGEASKVISEQFQKFGLNLCIFVDALDEVPPEMRADLIDDVRRLSRQGIRFVVSCKDVIWPKFVCRDGALNAFAEIVFPQPKEPEKGELPGWKLGRYNQQEMDAAWDKYSEIFHLTGNRSRVFNDEASLPYRLRQIGEKYENGEIPQSVDSLLLFDDRWNKNQEKIGERYRPTTLAIVREVARNLLTTGQIELPERTIWPQGLDDSKSAAYQALCQEYVLVVREAAREKFVRFYDEKFRSYAIAILECQWNDRIKMTDEQIVDSWLQYREDNEVFSSAVDFFIRAVDSGDSPLLSILFKRDFPRFIRLIPHLESPLRRRADEPPMDQRERELVVRKLEQRAVAFDALVNYHFPHLNPTNKPTGDYPIGCVASVSPDGVGWAYRPMTNEAPDRLILGENDPKAWLRDRSRVIHSGGWTYLAYQVPQYSAFDDVKEDLRKCVQRTHDRMDDIDFRLWEWSTLPLVYERAWHLLYHAPVYVDRTTLNHSFGVYNVLRIPDASTARSTPIQKLLSWILWQMLWQVTSDRMMTRVEEIGQDGKVNPHWQYPPKDIIVQEANRIWTEKSFTLKDYNYRGEEPEKLIDCYKCLEILAQQKEYLDAPVLPDAHYDTNGVWRTSRFSDEEVYGYVERLVPLVLESYRSMAYNNFPTLAPSLRLYKNPPAFTIAQVTTNGPWISIKYAFIKEKGRLNERFDSLYISRGQGLLPPRQGHDLEIDVSLDGVAYKGPADIYAVGSNSSLTLQDHVYGLIRWELNSALRRLRFHAF